MRWEIAKPDCGTDLTERIPSAMGRMVRPVYTDSAGTALRSIRLREAILLIRP